MDRLDPTCIRQTALPHTSRLFEDYSYHFDNVARFYAHDPHDPESAVRAAAAIKYPDDRRAALVAALRKQNGESVSLDLLAQSGTVAVVTGQQVGLFSGPAYTIFKALTAVKLAERLKEQGVLAVPIFWLATEDHDFAEVDHAWTFDSAHHPVELRGTSVDGSGQRPVGDLALNAIPIDQLRDCLQPFAYGSEVADLVAAAYPAGVTLGAGFRTLLKSLLAKYGILYLDPLAADIRHICAPFLEEVAAKLPQLKSALETRNRELTDAGYHAQVHVDQKTSLLFTLAGGRRAAWRGQTAVDQPELLSPNALLRPVMQDYLLPTVAYVGGPAELAYLAQSQVLYEQLLGRMPVAVHRSGFTILDARAKKLMARYQLPWQTIYEGESGIRDAIAHRLVPPQVQETFQRAERELEDSLAGLHRVVAGFDPTLAEALTRSAGKIRHQVAKMQSKTAREALRRDERATEEARFLSGLLYPNKHLQERFYTILPFLAKHGFDLIDTVYDKIALECPDHQVLAV